MSTITTAFRFALATAALCAAGSTADAKPRRLVVLDFDGPRQLADAGRSEVLAVLGEQYDVVATKRWEQARSAAAQQTHGPAQWAKAAKQSGVDAVIEGWVEDEGRRKILNVVVRQADNGREFDTISVRIDGAAGASPQVQRKLQNSLDEVLDWIEPGQHETPPAVPIINTKSIGPSKASAAADDDGEVTRGHHRAPVDDDDTATDPAPAHRRVKRVAAADSDTDGDSDTAAAPAPAKPARPAKPAEAAPAADAPGDAPAHDAKPTEVSAAEREAHELQVLFPPSSEDSVRVLGERSIHIPQKTPRFMIDGGLYYGSRSLIWDGPADANVQQAAGVGTKGFQLNVAVYPFPTKQMDGGLSGIGFTGSIHHSVSSSIEFDDTDEIDQYVINQTGWEFGVHYRRPLTDLVTFDVGAFYGNQSYSFVDASPDFEVPDSSYTYLGAGLHLDLNVTEHATIGFGARYFTVLDSGDLSSTDFYGPADANGFGLDATFQFPVYDSVYLRGQVSYQRISLELSGGGQITDDEGLTGGTDSLITASANVGIAF